MCVGSNIAVYLILYNFFAGYDLADSFIVTSTTSPEMLAA